LVWTLIASLFIGNTLLLALNLPLAPFWAKLLRVPRPYLYAGILFFATLGAYAVGLQAFNIVILLLVGALGYTARRYGFPVLPIIVGAILGPEMERQLRRALQISAGDPVALVSEPLAVVLYTVIAVFLVVPPIVRVVRRRASASPKKDDVLVP
jgi:putative tricarboxylic transport membrane protein